MQERGGHMADTALVVMARYPEAGKTKTRLARSIGDDRVTCLYRAFLTDLAQRFAGQCCHLHWAYTPAEVNYHGFLATLVPSLVIIHRSEEHTSELQSPCNLVCRLLLEKKKKKYKLYTQIDTKH